MTDEQKIAAAEIEVVRARSNLIRTVTEVSGMFEPKKIVKEVWESAKDKGADLAEDAVDAVKKRPYAAGAVAAGLVAFLARDTLFGLAKGAATKAKTKPQQKAGPANPTRSAAAKKPTRRPTAPKKSTEKTA